jgi:hypothetical protein
MTSILVLLAVLTVVALSGVWLYRVISSDGGPRAHVAPRHVDSDWSTGLGRGSGSLPSQPYSALPRLP